MDINLKSKEYLNGEYFKLQDSFFAISDRHPNSHGICEEYEIIQKIKENKEGYFDFNKALIDIGSEDGNYAMLLDFDKNYCFEPNKRMCCLINTNMYLKNKVYNTIVYNVALGDKDGDTAIFNGFAEKGSLFYEQSMLNTDKIEIIEKSRLDSYNIKNVGLIKVDTEGFDYFVLKGGIHTIVDNGYPPILFECWDVGTFGQTKEQYDRIMNFLKSIGYDVIEHWGDYETHLAIYKKVNYIVSMTTIPSRKKWFKEYVDSILKQSFYFDKFVINIDDNLTEGDYEFYESIKDFDERIEINVCDHKWRSCNKLLPTLKKYSNSVIITVDDDIYYPKDSIKKLVEEYEKNSDCIICLSSNPIKFNDNKYGGIFIVDDVCFGQKGYSKYLSNCCLFPPHIFDNSDLFDYDKMIMCTKGLHDELWFWVNSTLNGVKSINVNNYLINVDSYTFEGTYEDGYRLLNFNILTQGADEDYTERINELYGDSLGSVLSEKIEFIITDNNIDKFFWLFQIFKTVYKDRYVLNLDNLPKGLENMLKAFLYGSEINIDDVKK